MTALSSEIRYSRAHALMWRDTGVHVLVLPRTVRNGEVKVLGGGAALVWRLLDRSLDLAEVVATCGSVLEHAPSVDDISACLADLVSQGLLVTTTES